MRYSFLVLKVLQIKLLKVNSLYNIKCILKDFAYGKFSEIQYGKKITGFVYYSKENFCNEKKLPNLNEDYYYEDVSKPDNAIFILVDQ